ncbi:hypothetical protein LTR53_009008 [Teratosphaeriaceae sp. CCFEE 6253]|nr:hypothetical protein LTR53_009008 [Teratosphaeriaceae sp. CCFEE 6253]
MEGPATAREVTAYVSSIGNTVSWEENDVPREADPRLRLVMIYDLVAHGQIYGRKIKGQKLANRSVQLEVETIESQATTIAQQEGIIDDLRRQLSKRDALLLSLIQLTEQIADKDTELASLAREHSATAREFVAEEGGDADIDISDDDMISIDAAPVHRLEHLMDELMRGLVARQKGSRTQREVVLRPLVAVTVDHQCAQQKRHRPLRYCARCSASAPADSLKTACPVHQ